MGREENNDSEGKIMRSNQFWSPMFPNKKTNKTETIIYFVVEIDDDPFDSTFIYHLALHRRHPSRLFRRVADSPPPSPAFIIRLL